VQTCAWSFREHLFQGDEYAPAVQRVESMVAALKLLRDAGSHLPASTLQQLNDIIKHGSCVASEDHPIQLCRSTPGSGLMVEDATHSNCERTGLQHSLARQAIPLVKYPHGWSKFGLAPWTASQKTTPDITKKPGYLHVLKGSVSADRTEGLCKPQTYHSCAAREAKMVVFAAAPTQATKVTQCMQLAGGLCRNDASNCSSSALVIDKVACWKRRKEAMLRCRSGFEPCSADRQVMFMLVQQKQAGSRGAQFCTLGHPSEDVRMGQQLKNLHHGFALAETPEDALRLIPRRGVSESCMAVIKGIANGSGCARGALQYLPFFRPVYTVDLTVTQCN
jgi:hypothetical protein